MSENTKEPAQVQWLRSRALQLAESILAGWGGSLRLECGEALEKNIYRVLSETVKQTLDVLYYGGDLGSDAQVLADGNSRVEQACPQLMTLLRQAEARLSAVIPQTLERIGQHSGEIARELLQAPGFCRILDLDFGAGDSHNHGHTVVIITTEAGKFVYKPHGLMTDIVLRQISERFFPGFFHVPAALDCGEYGFCAYVENIPVTTREAAALYYRRLGGFCAVSRVLGSTDLHVQNMLCCDGYPVPIDSEMLFSPGYFRGSGFKTNQYLHLTLLNSCLMPSGLKGYEYSLLFSRAKDNVSAPVIDGRRQTLEDYPEEFIEGFRQVYRQALEQRGELLAYVHSLHAFPVRVILVATRVYVRILHRSYMWKWVTLPDRPAAMRQALLELTDDEERRHLLQIELEALLEGDIPYFYASVDSTDICSTDGLAAEDYLAMSARQRAETIIGQLSAEDMDFHCRMFRLGIRRAVRIRPDYVTDAPAQPLLTDEDCLARAESLAGGLLDELIPIPTGDVICFRKGSENAGIMAVAAADMMDGVCGIGIFLAAMLKNTRKDGLKAELREALSSILRTMRSGLNVWTQTDDSLYWNAAYGLGNGLTGFLMAANLIRRYTGSEACAQMCRDILSFFAQNDPEPQCPDIISGPAALLKLLCLYPELREYPEAGAVMHKAADRLLAMRQESSRLWLTLEKDRLLSGAAHGQSGIGTALALAGGLLDRPELTDAAEEALRCEAKLYSPELRGWPDLRRIAAPGSTMHGYCSGAPGIGMNALQRGSGDPYGLLDPAIDSCLRAPLLALDHFCCGNSAAVDFLLEAGRRLNRPELTRKSREILSAFSHRADQNGGYQFYEKGCRPSGVPTLFFGNAGVGYTLLRQVDRELESLML